MPLFYFYFYFFFVGLFRFPIWAFQILIQDYHAVVKVDSKLNKMNGFIGFHKNKWLAKE